MVTVPIFPHFSRARMQVCRFCGEQLGRLIVIALQTLWFGNLALARGSLLQ